MLRVLIIGYVWPEPCSSAAGSRMLELIDELRMQGWPVVFATPALTTDHQVDLRERGVDCRSIALNCDSFDGFVADLQPDIVLFDRFMMEEQFGWRVAKACPSALRVLDTEDLHSLRQTRQGRLQAILRQDLNDDGRDRAIADYMNAAPGELFQWMATEELAYREIAAIHRCDLTLMISEFEQALLVRQFGVPEAHLHYCPFMLSAKPPPANTFDERAHFVSLGNFRHAPNWDAVLWLKQRLWPGIRARLPHAELHLYGAYPPPKATALHNPREGFLVKGWAADARQVLGQARVCLAPLRFGAGIKGKLADAMTAGTPSVTTPMGAEAMAGPNNWPGVVAADPDALIAEAVELYSGRQRWLQAQEDGWALLAARFARQDHGPALIDRLQYCRASLQAHRQRNFTGAMLRHHFHQSTQYMGRWIEAKNRLKKAIGE
jgi:glycosyltransferase involved in cell wall biosynthesis